MIQLQLGQISQPKNQREPAAAERVVEFSKLHLPTITILVVLVLTVGFKAAYSYGIDRQAEAMAAKMKTSGQHSRELALVKAIYLDHQKGAENSKDRAEVMDQLRKSQAEHPLSTSGANVKDTEAVWLSSVKDQGASVSIQGMAVSADAVATLISDLETTGYFKNIEIRETYQDDKRNVQAFQFELTCEFGSKS